jgi:NADPH-dependent curcumin reductase CurA
MPPSAPLPDHATEIRLVRRPAARAGAAHFAPHRVALPEPGPGQVLVAVRWLAMDPLLNERATGGRVGPMVPLGRCMPGRGIGTVVAGALPTGTRVSGDLGWRSHAVLPAQGLVPLPEDPAVPETAWLGALGVPGLSAWIALHHVAQVRAGQTLLVTSAAGTVGAVAVQLALSAGVRVVGVAGGADKCRWLASLGAVAVDRTAGNGLAAALPEGFDAMLDLAGGRALEAALSHAKVGARIVLVGHVGAYGDAAPRLDADQVLYRRLALHGFLIHDQRARFDAARADLLARVRAGTLDVPQTVHDGLAQAPQALQALLEGRGMGRHLVRVEGA